MRGGKEESFARRQRTRRVIWCVQEGLCFHHLCVSGWHCAVKKSISQTLMRNSFLSPINEVLASCMLSGSVDVWRCVCAIRQLGKTHTQKY